jgi:chromosome segregation ATPase
MQEMDINHVALNLCTAGVIGQTEYNSIVNEDDRDVKTRNFVSHLGHSKHPDALKKLTEILRTKAPEDYKTKHARLAIYLLNYEIISSVLQMTIKELEQKMEEIKQEKDELQQEKATLVGQVVRLNQTNRRLEMTVRNLGAAKGKLTKKVANLTSQNKELTAEVANLTSHNKELTAEVANLTSKTRNLLPKLKSSKQKFKRWKTT